MEIILANDEKVLKSWDYSTAGHRLDKNKTQKTLTITNKRIVASEESTYTLVHEEIPIECVKGISGYYRKNDSGWMKFKRIMSLVFTFLIVGIPFGSIQAFLSLSQQIKSCVFFLEITTKDLEGSTFSIGAIPDSGLEGRRHLLGKSINKMKIYVDKNLGKEIVSEIGAIIHNNGEQLEKDVEEE